MTKNWKMLAAVVPFAMVVGCTDAAKVPAEAAMAAASAAVESLKGDAAKFAPEAVKSVESAYSVAEASMANKNYQTVITFAKDIPAKAKEALAAAAAKKEALSKAWNDASESMTKLMHEAKSRLDALGHAKKLPAGMDKAALAKAHAGLTSLQSGWASASEQYKSGDWSGAIAKANELKAQGMELLHSIGAHLGG